MIRPMRKLYHVLLSREPSKRWEVESNRGTRSESKETARGRVAAFYFASYCILIASAARVVIKNEITK